MNLQSRKTTNEKAIRGVSLAGLLATLALTSGCAPSPALQEPSTPASAGRHLYIGLDTSGSWRPYLGVSATLCSRQAMQLDPAQDLLTLYRMDSRTHEFSDGPSPESGDHLQRTIIAEVQAVSPVQGTFPARFFTAAAARAATDSGPVTVEVFSDGDNDDQTGQAQQALRQAARSLADNPHVVSVCVFGAAPANWAALRSEFAPLGARLHLCSPPEMTLDRVASAASGGE